MKKMDEMESKINQKGIKWSWAFTAFSLFIWAGYNFVKSQETSLPFSFSLYSFWYTFWSQVSRRLELTMTAEKNNC